MQKSAPKKATTKAPLKAQRRKSHSKRHNNAFQATTPAQNQRRDKFAESVLNIVKPKKALHQLLSTKIVSQPGDVIPTGAKLAPNLNRSLRDGYDIAKVKNQIPLPKDRKALSKEQIHRRRLFLNTFPRQSASPAGHIIQTQYTNYSVYRGVIDWAARLPEVDIKISVKERPDYTNRFDTRWYAEAMPRPRARVELTLNQMKFLTQLERDLLGEILGPRYNWVNDKIVLSIGNLRDIHASINRCFQLVHEAVFRAIEIAPHIQAQSDVENTEYKSQVKLIQEEELKINAAIKSLPFDKLHFTRDRQKVDATKYFVTTDSQHYIEYNPEFTMDDHVKYIPQVTLENILLTDKIPPGLAEPLRRRKDFDQAALAANPLLDPEQIVSPHLEPYSYASRARLVSSLYPKINQEGDEKDEPAPRTHEQLAAIAASDFEESEDNLRRYVSAAVLTRSLHPLDASKAMGQLALDIDNDMDRLDWLRTDDDESDRWADVQFAPR